ncbi:hypothetical protein RHMOL_Rhmol01G0326100 [Rhododendron molle]|uniref:Uncharacterized protein n=1 Tax=Rhododendron molle TaxID=49168 RepID=A0ACC0Q9E1_RHOML|nr:hypothetical protein RHMOL_Rhmol01G0326100 [Rhododendron molle]
MMLSGDIPPNQTIYIKNLNEKVKKEELKRSLYALFSQYGRVLDIVALKTAKLRGQAWVVFSDVTAATDRKRRGEEPQRSATANGTRSDINGGPTASFGKPGAQESAAAPNNILFIQNLPHESTSTMLQLLFNQYPGFREVRMIEAKPGIAFVEFEDDVQSSVAMQALQGFKISPQHPMAVTYAKK